LNQCSELVDEADPALASIPDVEAEIPFGEVTKSWPANTEHASIEELETNQTRPMLTVVNIEFTPRRKERLKQLLGDRVIRQYEVAPTGTEKGSMHGDSVSVVSEHAGLLTSIEEEVSITLLPLFVLFLDSYHAVWLFGYLDEPFVWLTLPTQHADTFSNA
jgi:hypothetical protein